MYATPHARSSSSALQRQSASLDVECLWQELEQAPMSEGEGDSGWTVGYVDILLLMVTLFSVLMGVAYLRSGEEVITLSDEVVFTLPMPVQPMVMVEIDPQLVRAAVQTRPQPPAAAKQVPVKPTPAAIHTTVPVTPMPVVEPALVSPSAFDQVAKLVSQQAGERLELFIEDRLIRLEMQDNILFASGKADLAEQGSQVLDQLALTLAREPLNLSVEGHTDDRPIATPRFPSNWELSSARATQVARYLMEKGVAAERIRVSGYADTRPRVANDSPENRSRNRRVSIVLFMPGVEEGAKDLFQPESQDWAHL